MLPLLNQMTVGTVSITQFKGMGQTQLPPHTRDSLSVSKPLLARDSHTRDSLSVIKLQPARPVEDSHSLSVIKPLVAKSLKDRDSLLLLPAVKPVKDSSHTCIKPLPAKDCQPLLLPQDRAR